MSSRTWQWHSASQVKGRGGKGAAKRPFPPAHGLIELDCTHLPVLRFSEKNFPLGWPQSDELQLGRPIASPALAFVFLVQQEFTAKLLCLRQCAAAASVFFSSRSVFGNLVAKDDLDSACAAWRTIAPRRCAWFYRPLHIFWAAVWQALGRLGAGRGSTPPWLHPPIHKPEPCIWWVRNVAAQQAAVVNSGPHGGSPSLC